MYASAVLPRCIDSPLSLSLSLPIFFRLTLPCSVRWSSPKCNRRVKPASMTSAASNRGLVQSDLREVVGRLKRTMRRLDVANNIYLRLEKLDKRWREGLAGESAWHRLDGLSQRLEQLRRDSDKAVRDCAVARVGGGGGDGDGSASGSADGSTPGFSSSGDSSENSELETGFSRRFQRGAAAATAAAAAAGASKARHRPGRANARDSTSAHSTRPKEAPGRYGNPDRGRASGGNGGAEGDYDEESPAESERSTGDRGGGRSVVRGSHGGAGETAGTRTQREGGNRGKKRPRKGSSSGREGRRRAASSARPRDDARRVGGSGSDGVGGGGGGGFGGRGRGRASPQREELVHDEPYLLGLDYSMAAASDEDGTSRGDPGIRDSPLSSLARSSSPSSSSSSSRSRSPLPPRQEGAGRRGTSAGGGKRGARSKAVRSNTSGDVHRRASSSRSRPKETGRKGGGGGGGGALVNSAAGGGGGNHRRDTERGGGGSGAAAGSTTARSGAPSSSSSSTVNHANRDRRSGRSGPHAGSRPRFEIDGRALVADLYRRQLAQQEAHGGAQPYRVQAPVRIDASGRAAHAQDAEHAAQHAEGGQLAESGVGRIPSGPPRLPSLVEDLVAKPRPNRATLSFTTLRAVSVFRVCVSARGWVGYAGFE